MFVTQCRRNVVQWAIRRAEASRRVAGIHLLGSLAPLAPRDAGVRSSVTGWSEPPFVRGGMVVHRRFVQTVGDKPPLPPASTAYVHYVHTLDPARLTSKDYLDLSGRRPADVRITTRRYPSRSRGGTMYGDMTSPTGLDSVGFPPTEYPPNTGGFLYLHRAPEGAPEVAAELRFRITNNPDPASFTRGKDRVLDGLPWSRPLMWCYMPLVLSLLHRDGLLSKTVMRRLGELQHHLNKMTKPTRPLATLLYSRRQFFVVRMIAPRSRLHVLQRVENGYSLVEMWYSLPGALKTIEGMEKFLSTPLPVGRQRSTRHGLYTGTAVAQFEWLPSGDDLRVAMRLVRVLEPISPLLPGLPDLKEGDLIPSTSFATGAIDPNWDLVVSGHSQLPWQRALYNLPDIPMDMEDWGPR